LAKLANTEEEIQRAYYLKKQKE
jgi:hypothetical protein